MFKLQSKVVSIWYSHSMPARMDLNKRSDPKQKIATEWKGLPKGSKSQNKSTRGGGVGGQK